MNPTAIWEAERPTIQAALARPGSKARNVRGALAAEAFQATATRIWGLPLSK